MEHKEVTKEQLSAENARLKSALEQSVAGIIVLDLDGNVTFVNETWSNMHGYTSEELLGKSMKVFCSDKGLKKFEKCLADALKKSSVSRELLQVKKDGKHIFIFARCFVTRNQEKKPNGFVISALDLSVQKHHEKELFKKTKELERFNSLFINRELKMSQLKKKIRELEKNLTEKKST